MDKIKLTESVWKAVFGKTPEVRWDCQDKDASYLVIDNTYSLIEMQDTIITPTINGSKKEKITGWSAGVEICTYNRDTGPDSDVVDLGFRRNFGDALILCIEANAQQIADNIMQAEYMAEAFAESEKYKKDRLSPPAPANKEK